MTIFYSPSTKGFYPDNETYSDLPDDLIEITQEKYDEFFSGKEGYAQVFDESGPRLLPVDEAIGITKSMEINQ